MSDAVKYAHIMEKILSVKKGAVPVVMTNKIYPIVSEDAVTGNITVLAENREILVERQFVRILSKAEAETLYSQEVLV